MGKMDRANDFLTRAANLAPDSTRRKPADKFYTHVLKRFLDILASSLGLLFLSPLFLIIALQIKRDSPGPIYYRGPRVGKGGKPFGILKFRTMYERPESYNGSRLTISEDDRVTPIGKWLRHTKLNELPNLWNVLVGDMSLIGPRPEDPTFVEKWDEDVRNEILSIRPGITSPASVTYRNEESLLHGENILDEYLQRILPEKLRMDQLYVRHHSLMGDVDVLFMTLVMLIPGWDAKPVKETALYRGPFSSFSDKYINWFVLDTIVAFASISLAAIIWRTQAILNVGFFKVMGIAAIIAILLAFTNTIFGLKNIDWRYASPTHVLDITVSTALAIGIWSLVTHFLFPDKGLPLALVILFGIFSLFGFVALRYRLRIITGLAHRWIKWRSQSTMIGERILVVGAGECAQLGLWMFEKSDLSTAFSVVGMVDDDYNKVNQRVNGYRVLGTTKDIPEIIRKENIGLIMFAINKVKPAERNRILNICEQYPVKVLMIPDLLTVVRDYFIEQTRKVPQINE